MPPKPRKSCKNCPQRCQSEGLARFLGSQCLCAKSCLMVQLEELCCNTYARSGDNTGKCYSYISVTFFTSCLRKLHHHIVPPIVFAHCHATNPSAFCVGLSIGKGRASSPGRRQVVKSNTKFSWKGMILSFTKLHQVNQLTASN